MADKKLYLKRIPLPTTYLYLYDILISTYLQKILSQLRLGPHFVTTTRLPRPYEIGVSLVIIINYKRNKCTLEERIEEILNCYLLQSESLVIINNYKGKKGTKRKNRGNLELLLQIRDCYEYKLDSELQPLTN